MDKKGVTKRRNPLLASFLSLISVGLGQFYNGEFIKGILLNAFVSLSFILFVYYSFSAYFGISYDLIFLCLFLLIFLGSKIYSIVQAGIHAKQRGRSYLLKPLNKSYLYLLIFLLFLLVPLLLIPPIMNHSLNGVSGHHPFRSRKAKADYMEKYTRRENQWPISSENRFIDTYYGKTFVRISGAEGSPQLLLLHGGGGNSLHWIANVKALSDHFRVVAVENIYDYGRSVYSRPVRSTDNMTDWLDELIEKLAGREKINLVGLSYGGWLAATYATKHAEKLNRLVLIAPFGAIMPITMDWVKKGILSYLPHIRYVRSFYHWALEHAVSSGESNRLQIEEDIELAYYSIRCFKPKSLPNPAVLSDAELAGIRTPTLLMVGEKEKLFSAGNAVQRIHTVAPQISTMVIPDSGHELTFTKPALVNSIIINFLLRGDGA